MTGWATAEAEGVPLVSVFNIVNEETRRSVENPAMTALKDEIIVGLANHTVLIAKDGTERPIDDSAAPIRSNEGEVVGCVLVFRDITARKRAEEVQRSTEEQFRRSIVRSPIPIIVHSDDDTVLQVSDGWTNFSGYTVRDIPTITDWTRLAYGERQATLKQFIDNLFHLDDTDHTGEYQIRAKNGSIRLWDFYTTPLGVTGPGGSRLLLSIGIAADQLPRIFDLFSQVDRSLEKSQGGLGIGLSLVRRLVEMHGGTVEVHSEGSGKGSEFVVRLQVDVEASMPQAPGNDQLQRIPKFSLRILIVDDNRDSADSLSMMLKILGNETRTAYDGEEAVAAANEFRPAVILLDIGLPKLNGYEVCRRVRQQQWGKELVIIAQTGWGQDEDRKRTREAGFDQHIVKPVDPQVLKKLLADLSEGVRK